MFEAFAAYIGKEKGPNRFWRVDQADIGEAQSRIGMEFPSDLRAFFTEVGSGFWTQGTADSEWDRSLVNRIPTPKQIADLVCHKDDPWRPHEGFVKGAIPFFDLGENTYFILIPKQDALGRVYWPNGKHVVSESLQDFFEKLELHAGFFRAI